MRGVPVECQSARVVQPDSGAAVKALFHSAEDTIRMWEACEAAAPNVDVP